VILFLLSGKASAQSVPKNSKDKEFAVLAGGCFWGMEDILRKETGVVDTIVGYTGGHLDNPQYGDLKTGKTGHAESILVTFDPKKTNYGKMLDLFFKMHDPTTLNRQGNDVGTQYRSAIFYVDDSQKEIAQKKKLEAGFSGIWKKPVVTQIDAVGPFYPAEEYHQDYLQKNPGGYSCHYVRKSPN